MEVVEIDKHTAINFVHQFHYSKILPRLTKYYLGIYENNELQGVFTLGWGTQPLHTIKKIFYKHDMVSENYIEIGKMCFLPKCNNSNFGSRAIKEVVKWLKSNTNIMFLYTLADGIMGKCGYVYQASNFIYIGKFKTSVYMNTRTGEKIHPRSAKQLCKENAFLKEKRKYFGLPMNFANTKELTKSMA